MRINYSNFKYIYCEPTVAGQVSGNVMATVNDRKVYDGSNFVAKVMSAQTYYPGGSIETGRMMNSSAYRFGQNTQEADMEISGIWGTHYTAEFWEYDARLMRRWNIDPVFAAKPWINPYHAFSNNSILNIDPNGAIDNPIYDVNTKEFLGTDDKGMSHDEAMFKGKTLDNMSENEALVFANSGGFEEFLNHYNSLKDKPDYEGFVTPSEGRAWAKSHPYALESNNPNNTLYIDASKLNFGTLSTSEFKHIGTPEKQNLYSAGNFLQAAGNSDVAATVYALGRVNMTLLDNEGHVSIVNNEATDYDWNTGGGFKRQVAIHIERSLHHLYDCHGFKAYFMELENKENITLIQ